MVIDDAIEINADDYQKFLVTWIQAAIMFGIAWGIGGILTDESRKRFDQFHKKVSFVIIKINVDCKNSLFISILYAIYFRFGAIMTKFQRI